MRKFFGYAAICMVLCVSVVASVACSAITGPSCGELEIISHHRTTGEYGNEIIAGTAQNTGSDMMDYAEVEVKFYGSGGVLLDTWIDNINNLGGGETWSFEVYYIGDGTFSTYTIAAGDCYCY